MKAPSSGSTRRLGVPAGLPLALALTLTLTVVAVEAAQAASAPRAAPAAPAPRPTRANLLYAGQQVARYRLPPVWRAPGPPIDASEARGKTIFIVPIASALPYQKLLGAGIKAAAKAVGVTIKEQTNEGSPAQWATASSRRSRRRSI